MIKKLLLKYWRQIASFIGMAVFLGWIAWQSHQIDVLTEKLTTAEESLATYKEGYQTLQDQSAAKIKALEEETARQIQRTQDKERLLGRIKGAKNEDDAPVAPVLRDTIDRLYGRSPDQSQDR